MEFLADYWVLLLALLAVLWFLLANRSQQKATYPYRKKSAIMSPNEQEFYHALLRASGDDFDVFAMVRLADVISVAKGAPQRQSWQGRINSKHIDFLLCDRDTQEAVLAIEVDDRSHQRRDRQERDYFVDRAFDAALLPLMRVEATRSYSSIELKSAIQRELQRKRPAKLPSERRVKVG